MSIPSWARPGVKVACIDANWSSAPPADPLRFGQTYTIARAFMHTCSEYVGAEAMCELVEIDHPFIPGYGYLLDRFAPLTEISESDDTEARIFHAKRKSAGIRVTVEG